jgi:lysozyme family protein
MTAANYQAFVERMISRYEGGYGWDRNDSGGPTKYGITCYDLAEHRGKHMDMMVRWAPLVKAMTLTEADDIYRTKYAVACAFDDLKSGCDCVLFDFGVNSGPRRAVFYAQRVVGVTQDGIIGSITTRAINAAATANFINSLCDHRLAFLHSLAIWSSFGKGWSARIKDLRSYALGLLKQPEAELFQTKSIRIHLAFAKGWRIDENSVAIA